jgi:hypothetical protein
LHCQVFSPQPNQHEKLIAITSYLRMAVETFYTRDNRWALGKGIPVNLLAFMAERAGSKKTLTIEGASHAVMMSHADAVVELVEQAASAVGGDGITADDDASASARNRRRNQGAEWRRR